VLDAWAGVTLAVWSTPRPVRHRQPAVSTAVPGINASGPGNASVGRCELARRGHRHDAVTGRALNRLPDDVAVFAVEAEQTGYGVGLTPGVAAAVPVVVDAVLAEINAETEGRQRSWAPTGW
jgi:hydrogenase maturation protease